MSAKSPRSLEPENNLVIIIGAGASVPMGIPVMKRFAKEFEKHCNEVLSKDDAKQFMTYSLRHLKKMAGIGRHWDLEELLLRIMELKNAENSAIIKLYKKFSFKGNSKPKDKFDQKISTMALEYSELERELLRFIRDKCIRPDIEKGVEIYSNLVKLTENYRLEIFTTIVILLIFCTNKLLYPVL